MDLIERQAAIDALRYAQHRFTVADEAGGMGTVKWSEDVIYFAAAERVLSELPSAQPEQPEQRWIPVSERLPNGFQTCIVTDELRQCSYEYDYNPDNEFTKKYGWRYNGRKIIAWMPLPEPWKEGEADGQR